MDQFITITYHSVPEQMAIELDVRSRPGTVELFANRDGMARLAELVADILLHPDPASFSYVLGHKDGIPKGSPTLKIEFDEVLDQI